MEGLRALVECTLVEVVGDDIVIVVEVIIVQVVLLGLRFLL